MAGFTITDAEFTASKADQERVYSIEGNRQAGHSYLDALGHARWDTDYYTLRAGGWAHEAALQEVRCRIREAWTPPLPAVEPHPEPPVPQPGPTPPPSGDVPGVKDNMERFANFYLLECGRRRWAPNQDTTRDERVQFLQEAVVGYRAAVGDLSFVMKRASAGRPIGDDVVVFTTPGVDYRRFWDFIGSAGIAEWKVRVDGPGEILPADQLLVDPHTLETIPG